MCEKVIYVVGIGPGKIEKMTREAYDVLEKCDVIVGYTVYIDLLKSAFPGKEFASTPMKQEIERCKMCFDLANAGKKVALVCSGDAGVYGMASPLFELLEKSDSYKDVEIVVVPGVTAANSGAAILGAPLNHDYCVISLSDLLTPWEQIEKRLVAAVHGDFAVALYNPASHKRRDYLRRACEVMISAGANAQTPCGYAQNIGRDDEKTVICTLSELMNADVNMFTTVFVGNSQTQVCESSVNGKRLVTKRGYEI